MEDLIIWHSVVGLTVGFCIGGVFLTAVGKKSCGISMVIAIALALLADLTGITALMSSGNVVAFSGGLLLLWLSLLTGIVALVGCGLSGPIMRSVQRWRDHYRPR